MNTNESQEAAIYSAGARTAVIAGPGSGKTHVLASRAAWELSHGLPREQLAAITYTWAAARHLEGRIFHLGCGEDRIDYAGTIHGFVLRLLRRHGTKIGLPPRLSVISDEVRDTILGGILGSMRWKPTKAQLAEVTATGLVWRPSFPLTSFASKAQEAAFRFRELVWTEGLLDFDGILLAGRELAPHLSALDVPASILVDEFQDVSDLDWSILSVLPVERLFVVGDPDQAIFGFRGGNPGILFRLTHEPTWTTFVLKENYRSDTDVCLTADLLIRHNQARFPKILQPVSQEPGEVLFVSVSPTPVHEAAGVAQDIATLPEDWTCAVICRTNNLVKFYSEQLETLGLRTARLEDRQKPEDWGKLRIYLSFLCNPENDHLARMVLERCLGVSEDEAVKATLSGRARCLSLNQHHPRLKVPCGLDILSALDGIQQAGFSTESMAMIRGFAKPLTPTSDLSELALALGTEELGRQEVGEGIWVGTFHGAKGREWDAVYLVAMEAGIIPSRQSKDSPQAMEEERRLAFVGATRAKHRLVISRSKMRAAPWEKQPKPTEPSQFFIEMAADIEVTP